MRALDFFGARSVEDRRSESLIESERLACADTEAFLFFVFPFCLLGARFKNCIPLSDFQLMYVIP